ncbi:hypothetical protein, partial [Tropheryma whipplei]|uniref:hypothetical protein n=1 Tax=Tropheryma whipplei TaxID=2039 RepID=UPI00056DE378
NTLHHDIPDTDICCPDTDFRGGGTRSLAEQEHNRTKRGANLFGLFASAVGTAVKTKLKELKSTVQRKGKELQNTITRPLQQAVDNTVQTVVAQAAQSATQAVQSQPVQAQVQQLTSTATSAVSTLANTVLDDLLGRAKETAKTVGYSLLGVLAAALTGFTIFAIVKWGR